MCWGYYCWKTMSSQNAATCGSGKASEWNTGYEKPSHVGPSGVPWVLCREYMCQPILHNEDKSCDWKCFDSFPNTAWPLASLSCTGERHSVSLGSETNSFPSSMRWAQQSKPVSFTKKPQTALWVAPFWTGGGEHTSMNIHSCAFRRALCKDPLKTDENRHKRVWLVPESAGPCPRTHAMVVIESWFTKSMLLQMCGLALQRPPTLRQAQHRLWDGAGPQIQNRNLTLAP